MLLEQKLLGLIKNIDLTLNTIKNNKVTNCLSLDLWQNTCTIISVHKK